MRLFTLLFSTILGMASITWAASTPSKSLEGKVTALQVSSGGFVNAVQATVEVTLTPGVPPRKDLYSICQDMTDREYASMVAVLIDSRSRSKQDTFYIKPISATTTDIWCITSITSR